MNKKQRTIKATRELIKKYREVTPGNLRYSFDISSCPLCKIHHPEYICEGCPLANTDGDMGCTDFRSYAIARIARKDYDEIPSYSFSEVKKAFEKRAQFHEKALEIYRGIPAERFTVKGWEYFDELDRSW